MKQSNIEILEQQRPRVELFFRTGSLVLSADAPHSNSCERCIDTVALVRVMREEFEPGANLNPFEQWEMPDGYKGFLSRLFCHYDRWAADQVEQKSRWQTGSLNTIRQPVNNLS
jgi:hypothetical protein